MCAWGLDIACSLADPGGVDALLQIFDHASGKSYLPVYDGNGNGDIAALSNATTGALAAIHEYTPFGESIRTEVLDSALTDQPFRFSTKWTDDESGLLNFGRRYYEPRSGRFVGRDPISEEGGLNLYAFCRNNSINRWDILGMIAVSYNGQKIDSSKLLDGVIDLEDGSDEDESKLSEFLTDDEIVETNKYIFSGSEGPSYGSFGEITVLDVIIIDSGGGNVAPNNAVYDGGTRPTVNVTGTMPKSSGGVLSTVGSFLGGVVKGAVGGFVGGVVIGAIAAVSAPVAITVGGGALVYGAYKWADGGFKVTADGLGQVVGGVLTGGLGARVGNFAASTALDGAIVQVGWKGGEITLTNPNKASSVPGATPTPDIRINPTGTWSGGADSLPLYHARPRIGNHRPWQGGP